MGDRRKGRRQVGYVTRPCFVRAAERYPGTILRTDDGGASWTPQSSRTTQGLSGVFTVDANTGIAVGIAGTILRTDDGGQ